MSLLLSRNDSMLKSYQLYRSSTMFFYVEAAIRLGSWGKTGSVRGLVWVVGESLHTGTTTLRSMQDGVGEWQLSWQY
jgi:hypothetical protein